MSQLTKSILQQTCFELASELAKQPALFFDNGEATESLERYTGTRVATDDERCHLAAALRLIQASDREIAKLLHCDVRSIPLMLRVAEKSGRIPALKERLITLIGANAESAAIALNRLLESATHAEVNIERAAMIKALATTVGITTEKILLLTGSATEIVEHRVAAGRDEMEAWAKLNAIPIEVSVDLESPANGAKPKQIEGNQ